MAKLLRTFGAVFAVALAAAAMPAFGQMGAMSGSNMYNLKIDGLGAGADTRRLEEKLRALTGVERVHVDRPHGLVMVYVKKGTTLDQVALQQTVRDGGFALEAVEPPK